MARGDAESRNKKKGKFKNPYKAGGKYRSTNLTNKK